MCGNGHLPPLSSLCGAFMVFLIRDYLFRVIPVKTVMTSKERLTKRAFVFQEILALGYHNIWSVKLNMKNNLILCFSDRYGSAYGKTSNMTHIVDLPGSKLHPDNTSLK